AKIFVPNLTPAGLGKYSDEQLFRAITGGIGTNGKVLFPVMPYLNYAKADPEDIKAIIAYLRSLKPIEHDVRASKVRFPVNLIANTFPEEPHFVKRPDPGNEVEYGKYLVTVAGCGDCHTPRKGARLDESRALSGGSAMKLPGGGKVRGPNLTPDKSTGLGAWTKAVFINRFKMVSLKGEYTPHTVPKGGVQTNMPWTMYAEMKVGDLDAIYEYLHSLKPVEHAVKRWYAPKKQD
ncbi:MAG: cytochrome C, partial [Saprospiraceae bacterium]